MLFRSLPWIGLFGPPNLPPDITEQMSDALGKIFADETFVARLQKMGPEPYYLPSAPFAAFVAADIPVWAEQRPHGRNNTAMKPRVRLP